MKRFLAFAATSVAVIVAMLLVMLAAFRGDDVRRAVKIAGVVALGVQLLGYAVTSVIARNNVMAGWGIGILIRFGAVVAFGVVATRTALPVGAALMSLAAFLFVSTVFEPLFLKQ